MNAPDPEIQAAVDTAIRELARRLKPYMAEDTAHTLAAAYVHDLRTQRWNPPLKPPAPERQAPPPADPETRHEIYTRLRAELTKESP